MKTVADKNHDPNNADFVEAIGEIIGKIQTLAAPREDASPASSRGQSPARVFFPGPNSPPTSVPRGAGARSLSPGGILKHPCANPSCTKTAKPETGYCGKVCSMQHTAPCKNGPQGCRVSAANCLPGGLCCPNCMFEQLAQETIQHVNVPPPCSNHKNGWQKEAKSEPHANSFALSHASSSDTQRNACKRQQRLPSKAHSSRITKEPELELP